jgi:predicted permease
MWNPLRALIARRRLNRDFRDEVADHLARDIAYRVRQGASEPEARRAALAAFGSPAATHEALDDVHHLSVFTDLGRDVGFAARRLRRSPGYTLLVVVTISLGLGAATAVFGAVDGVLLKPLPFRDPGALVTLWQTKPAEGLDIDDVAPRTFLDWRDQTTSYTALAAANPWSVNFRGADHTSTVEAWQVSEGFFRLLDARPAFGRTFRPEDFTSGSAPVVVLDHQFWQSRFGGDREILGRSITLDERPHVVIGVMPAGLSLPARTAAWLPWVPDSAQQADRFGTYLKVFARLKPGVSAATASAELEAIGARLTAAYPRSNSGVGAKVIPLQDHVIGGRAPLLWTLLTASVLLLVVTVANVSALHLTRLARHRQETSVRAALGARGIRLARPLLLEAFLLAMAGGTGGVALAWVALRWMHRVGPAELPQLEFIQLDARSLAVALLLSLVAGLVLASLAVVRLQRSSALDAFGSRSEAGARGARAGRRVAVVTQLAVACVLLVGTSLLVRSFVAVLSAERGYRTDHLLSFTTWVYAEYPRSDDRARYVTTLMDRLGALPGVRRVSMGSSLPLADQITGDRADIVMDGAAVVEGEEPQAQGMVVWPNYHETLGIGLRRGRGLGDGDEERGELVVVVNEAFVRRFSPDRDVIGRSVGVGLMGRARQRRVVGVVADTRHARLDTPPQPAVYIPWRQQPLAALTFVLRTDVEPGTLAPVVERTVFEIDPRVGTARVSTLDDLVVASVRERRFLLLLIGGFAGIAVVLACVGVAGVLSQAVVERTREIGVRMALGAAPAAIRRELLGDAARMTAIGLVVGLGLALAGSRLFGAFLYGISARDPWGYAAAVVLLGGLALVAGVAPSLRATRTDPASVLR